jgi:hypothetical protein
VNRSQSLETEKENTMLIFADIVTRTCPKSKTLEQWRSRLNAYLKDPAVREVMGAANHPNYDESALSKFLQLSDMAEKGEVKPATLAAVLRGRLEREALASSDPDVRKKYGGTENVQTENIQPERTVLEQVEGRGQALARRNMVQMPDQMVVALPPEVTDTLSLMARRLEEWESSLSAMQSIQQQTADVLSLVAEKIGDRPTVADQSVLPRAPIEDRLIGNEEAARLLDSTARGVGRLLRRLGVDPVLPGKWRLSQVLRLIECL